MVLVDAIDGYQSQAPRPPTEARHGSRNGTNHIHIKILPADENPKTSASAAKYGEASLHGPRKWHNRTNSDLGYAAQIGGMMELRANLEEPRGEAYANRFLDTERIFLDQ